MVLMASTVESQQYAANAEGAGLSKACNIGHMPGGGLRMTAVGMCNASMAHGRMENTVSAHRRSHVSLQIGGSMYDGNLGRLVSCQIIEHSAGTKSV